MNDFTIKDIENLSGVKAHTIRMWEQRYSFLKPNRTRTNIRYYSNDDLKTILNIALLNKCGFKLCHLDRMEKEEIRSKILTLHDCLALRERILHELITSMVSLDIESFEKMLDKSIKANGVEKTILEIIFPFLERTGMLWQTGHINPAQEHVASNLIRQKLIAGIESAKASFSTGFTFLLFLPEGEYHELGLLFTSYLLKARGHKIIYLGANIPAEDVEYATACSRPDFIYVHLSSAPADFRFEKFINWLSRRFPKIKSVVSGPVTLHCRRNLPPSILLKKSIKETIEFIVNPSVIKPAK
jgi:DNA-binding transcriptional MerR regulator